jgi:sugar phosphate isomerase/epimerase
MRLGIEAGIHTLEVAVREEVRGVPVYVEELIQNGVRETLAPLRDRGLEVCQIGAFNFNPLSPDLARQAEQKAMLKKVIPLAAEEIGCPYVVICGGNYHPSGFSHGDFRNFSDEAIDTVAHELAPMVELAEKHGTRLTIEPYIKTAINTPERFLALKKKINSDALRINIDVTSFYGYWEMLDSQTMIKHVCTLLQGHYGLGHIKDLALTEGFHIHIGLAPLGSSSTDWSQVLRLMAPYLPDDSWVILEHVASKDEAHKSLYLLRQAAKEAGINLW